eukprot:scaffold2816_cov121-Cylindrotheca_fusiformis.AAC.47
MAERGFELMVRSIGRATSSCKRRASSPYCTLRRGSFSVAVCTLRRKSSFLKSSNSCTAQSRRCVLFGEFALPVDSVAKRGMQRGSMTDGIISPFGKKASQ